jgi:hypothetical protein
MSVKQPVDGKAIKRLEAYLEFAENKSPRETFAKRLKKLGVPFEPFVVQTKKCESECACLNEVAQ